MSATDTASADFTPLVAFAFDGKGGVSEVDPAAVLSGSVGPPEGGFVWVHLRRGAASVDKWFAEGGLDEFVVSALTADETRPRCTVHGDGALVNLRGVNLNPGAEPDDMISVRLWVEQNRVVGVWVRALNAISDLVEALRRGYAPVSPGDFVAKLAVRLADRAEPVTAELNERVDELEEALLVGDVPPLRSELGDIRQTAIGLRRFIFPQRDALTTMQIEELPWLSGTDRSRLREAADRVTRLAEELDSIRDRAEVIHDQIMDQRAELMERRMLLLSVVAAVFLPLSLIAGLLGMNVGGIPGADQPSAFVIICGLFVALVIVQLALFRWWKLI